MQKYIIYILSFIVLVIMQLTNPVQAIVWDSKDYNTTEAQKYVKTKVWKINNGGCSAVKVKNRWIASAEHCGERTSFTDSGQTFRVIKNLAHSTADARLYQVDNRLPAGRKNVTGSYIQIGDRFKKLGRGAWGAVRGSDTSEYVITGKFGTWHGGRNEVDFIGTDRTLSRVRYNFDQNYANEVGIWFGDSGGPASIGRDLVGTSVGIGLNTFVDTDWTRMKDWWYQYL